MTAQTSPTDFAPEREIDLGSWRRALAARWWFPTILAIVGAIAGVLYSFHTGSTYKAAALISLGQVTSAGGATISNFAVNPLAVAQIVTSSAAQAEAAAAAGIPAAALRGRVSVAQVGVSSSTIGRSSPLVSLTVTGRRPGTVAAAATTLARIAVRQTTEPYVNAKIATFKTTLKNVERQLAAVSASLRALERSHQAQQRLSPLERLVVVSQADDLGARQGNLIAQQGTLETELAFANKIESARIIETAKAVKASAQSRTTSSLVGALIGLLLGAIAAIAKRAEDRPQTSTA